jgi:DNA (cytosine-5)-methyltransferase 1
VTRPRLLDLYCGAGGAARGYHDAGFDVVGVDIAPQPNYPYDFIQADALLYLRGLESVNAGINAPAWFEFDAIHASPPCQAYSAMSVTRPEGEWPDLIAPTRALLTASGLPWVMENVAGAPLINPIILCGTSFGLGADGFEHRRHRYFESSFPMLVPNCHHSLPAAPLYGHNPGRDWMRRYGRSFGIALKCEAMGIDWMNREELAEAIPPAFTDFIGAELLRQLGQPTLATAGANEEGA